MSRLRTAELVWADGSYETITSSGGTTRFGDPAAGGLSPMDALLAALGACTAMDVHAIATKKRQRIDRYVVRVTGEQRAEHPRIYSRIEITHEVEGRGLSLEAIRRSIELSALNYCPVSAMLSTGPTEIHHHYRVRASEPEPWEAAGEVVVTGPGWRADVAPVG